MGAATTGTGKTGGRGADCQYSAGGHRTRVLSRRERISGQARQLQLNGQSRQIDPLLLAGFEPAGGVRESACGNQVSFRGRTGRTRALPMNDALNILLVDDNPDDRAAAMRELRQAFPNCQFHHAANSKDLFLAIECGGLDVVITDYHLGWSDGITVLLSVKARNQECPVIMFTGRGNEDIAVRAMKAGLDDYVLKSPDQTGRLPAAVQMTLEQNKQHQAI